MALFAHKKGHLSSFTLSQMASPLGGQNLSPFAPAPQLLLESLNKLRVQIYVGQTLPQMLARFHRRGMIAILPVGSLALLSLVVQLTAASSHQLQRMGMTPVLPDHRAANGCDSR